MASKKCSARNRQGKRCGAWARRGERRCELHSEKGMAQKLGSRGGHRRARYSTEELTPIAQPQNAADLLKVLAQVIAEVHEGRLEAKVANSVAYLGSAFISALQVSDLADRVAELERRQQAVRGN